MSCRVWIGCLSTSNSDQQHGRWFEGDELEFEKLKVLVAEMLRWGPGGESGAWYIRAYEGFMGLMPTSLEEISTMSALIEEYGEVGVLAWNKWGEDAIDWMDFYLGTWDSWEAYAKAALVDADWEHIRPFVDLAGFWEFLCKDLQVITGSEGVIYVFDCD